MPQQATISMFEQGYTNAAPSFSMPNFGLVSYTIGGNNRTYTNNNDNFQSLYTIVAYNDPIPLLGSSIGFFPNYAYNNATWFNTDSPSEYIGFGYETSPQFLFRPQPIDMTPA
jgi:hypothetical protein